MVPLNMFYGEEILKKLYKFKKFFDCFFDFDRIIGYKYML